MYAARVDDGQDEPLDTKELIRDSVTVVNRLREQALETLVIVTRSQRRVRESITSLADARRRSLAQP